MGVLDQVMDLRSRGVSDQEIIRMLQEQGVSPAGINDAFGRAQIKSAVSSYGVEQGMEHSILEKVGGYGHGLETVKKEMGMMQDSFGKMVNQIAEKSEPKHHVIHRSEKKTTVIHKTKKREPRKKHSG